MTAAERTRAYRQRIMADAAEIERRRREYLERQRRDYHTQMGHIPAMRVLTAWHRDAHGCMARTVGCE